VFAIAALRTTIAEIAGNPGYLGSRPAIQYIHKMMEVQEPTDN
jgi:hypothetical protein